jgi:hypothetical protein
MFLRLDMRHRDRAVMIVILLLICCLPRAGGQGSSLLEVFPANPLTYLSVVNLIFPVSVDDAPRKKVDRILLAPVVFNVYISRKLEVRRGKHHLSYIFYRNEIVFQMFANLVHLCLDFSEAGRGTRNKIHCRNDTVSGGVAKVLYFGRKDTEFLGIARYLCEDYGLCGSYPRTASIQGLGIGSVRSIYSLTGFPCLPSGQARIDDDEEEPGRLYAKAEDISGLFLLLSGVLLL